jgi:hypothetical protein
MARNWRGKIVSELARVKPGDVGPNWPIYAPLSVGVMQLQRDAEGHAASMVVVLDPEEIPGLAEALDRQGEGHVFDTSTTWGVGRPPQFASHTPLLALELPEIDLGFYVAIDADRYLTALKVVTQTKNVMIVDGVQYSEFRSKGIPAVDQADRSLVFQVEDVDLVLPLILQRLDASPGSPESAAENETTFKSAEEFIDGASPVELARIQMQPGEPPILIFVDPKASPLNNRLGSKPYFDGSWSAISMEDGPLARLDCSSEGERIASWFLRPPSQELVRTVISGAHGIFIVDRELRGDDEETMRTYIRQGVPIFVTSASRQEMLKILGKKTQLPDDAEAGQSR